MRGGAGDFRPSSSTDGGWLADGSGQCGLARYDRLLAVVPNAAVLLSPLTTQSRIEGTTPANTHFAQSSLARRSAIDGEIGYIRFFRLIMRPSATSDFARTDLRTP
ncbi:MAG: hypothetical protein EA381_15475 [Planctomycetaceae bacterium]|nr:MAG: hypothetical protein EA381_15475 [Planctomycetaceae bacterium]